MQGFDNIIGASQPMKLIYKRINQAASNDINVLILGESGTGKDLIAQAIHRHSSRSRGPFIPINMGAIARDLVASELFGHQKGAFTGATETKTGKFEQATDGTIFLDEISTMDDVTQVSLLRILETSKYQRIGGRRFITSNARIIAASNENLIKLDDISNSNLRQDLYHRLSVFTIVLPPLRDRTTDIQILADYFLQQAATEFEKKVQGFDEFVIKTFHDYPWPGNVRELKNIVQRAVLICPGKYIKLEHLPERIKTSSKKGAQSLDIPLGMTLKDIEKLVIRETIALTGGNRKRAAEILGISRRALYNKIDSHNI